MKPLSELDLACIHEAAHAVATFNCRWHFICDTVSASDSGHGSAPFQMDNAAASAELYASGNADKVFFKAAIIAVIGVCAENRLRRERAERELSVNEAFLASPSDVAQANDALDRMVNPISFSEVVQKAQVLIDSNEVMWKIISQFAEALKKSRNLSAREATDMIHDLEQQVASATGGAP